MSTNTQQQPQQPLPAYTQGGQPQPNIQAFVPTNTLPLPQNFGGAPFIPANKQPDASSSFNLNSGAFNFKKPEVAQPAMNLPQSFNAPQGGFQPQMNMMPQQQPWQQQQQQQAHMYQQAAPAYNPGMNTGYQGGYQAPVQPMYVPQYQRPAYMPNQGFQHNQYMQGGFAPVQQVSPSIPVQIAPQIQVPVPAANPNFNTNVQEFKPKTTTAVTAPEFKPQQQPQVTPPVMNLPPGMQNFGGAPQQVVPQFDGSADFHHPQVQAQQVNNSIPSNWFSNQPKSYNASDFRVANVVIQSTQPTIAPTTAAAGGFKVDSKEFVFKKPSAPVQAPPADIPKVVIPPPAPPVEVVDPLTKKMRDLKLGEQDIASLKSFLENLRKTSQGPAKIQLLKEFKQVAQNTEGLEIPKNAYWEGAVDRKVNYIAQHSKSDFQKGGYQGGNKKPWEQGKGRGRGGGRYNDQNAEGFDSRREPRQPQEPPTEEQMLMRAQVDKEKKELAEKSRQYMEELKNKEETVQKQITRIVNIILPDNFEKKFNELRGYMFPNLKLPDEEGYDKETDTLTETGLNQDNLAIVVETIFRKAQNEKQYCSFYGELCEKIIRLELAFKGQKATVKNIRNSQFREKLLKNCKISFEHFFTAKTKTLYESKDHEEIHKYQQRLLGNILFVGELNRRGLLQESIILSVFDMLLCVDSEETQLQYINDHTVEGAVVLMTKIGSLIDGKLQTIEEQTRSAQEKGTSAQIKSADLQTADKIKKTFARFEDLTKESSKPQLSNRIKLLIKNMLEFRVKGWPKEKEEKGPMKVEDLRKEMERKIREEQEQRYLAEREEQSYLEGTPGGRNRGQRGYQGGGQGYYQEKNQQYAVKGGQKPGGRDDRQGQRDQRDGQGRGQRRGGDNYAPKQGASEGGQRKPAAAVTPIEHKGDKEMEKDLMENFNAYSHNLAEDPTKQFTSEAFQVYNDLKSLNGRSVQDIVYAFLNKVFDRSEQEIEEVLPRYLKDLIASGFIDRKGITEGLSKFLNVVPNISADYPHLKYQLSNVMLILHEANKLNFKELNFFNKPESPDDEPPMVEDYYRLIAHFLHKLADAQEPGSDAAVITKFYKSDTPLATKLNELRELILEDDLYNDIEKDLKEIGSPHATLIRQLIEGTQ